MFDTEAAATPATTRNDLRDAVSDAVNRTTWGLLRKYELRVPVAGGRTHNLLTSLRRFQLVYLEEYFVDALKRDRRVADEPRVSLDVSAFVRPPAKRGRRLRAKFALGPWRQTLYGAFFKVRRRIQLYFILKKKRVVPTSRVRRLFFIDAGELKRSHIGKLQYVYQKYMEGLVDMHYLRIEPDTLVVLYGVLDQVDNMRLEHPRVALLAAHQDREQVAHVGDLIDNATWESAYGSGGIDPSLAPILAREKRHFEYLMRIDLGLIQAADRFLSHFREDLEIVLDNFDSTLFPLSQYLLEHYPQHKVVGLQKVLGPYTFSFNLRDDQGLVRQPHRILTWGPFHDRRLRDMGYTCELEPSCLFKLKVYSPYLTLDRDDIKTRASLPLDMPIVMVSAVQSIIGFPLMDKWEYTQMLLGLADLANSDRCFVMFKPWPGEDPTPILEVVKAGFKRNWALMQSAQGEPFHNVELLRVTDIMISTMSSFIGEAIYFGIVPVLVDTPAAEAYFSPEYTQRFRQMCYPRSGTVAQTVDEILSLDAARYKAWRDSILPQFRQVFGDAL